MAKVAEVLVTAATLHEKDTQPPHLRRHPQMAHTCEVNCESEVPGTSVKPNVPWVETPELWRRIQSPGRSTLSRRPERHRPPSTSQAMAESTAGTGSPQPPDPGWECR